MAINLATLRINLAANSAQFRQDMAGAARTVTDFSRSTAAAAGNITAAMAGVTVAVGAGLAAAYGSQSEQISDLARVADRLGVTTQELTAFRNAAELAGVETEDLDDALQTMNELIYDATNETGELYEVLGRLGLSAEELLKQGPAAAFVTLKQSLEEVDDPMQRTLDYIQAFSGDPYLINLDLSDVGGATDQLEALGGALKRLETAQVQAARREFIKMKQALRLAAEVLTVELAPYVRVVTKELFSAAGQGGNLRDVIGEGIVTTLQGGAKVLDWFREMNLGLTAIITGFKIAWAAVSAGAASLAASLAFYKDSIVRGFQAGFATLKLAANSFFSFTLTQAERLINGPMRALAALVGQEVAEFGGLKNAAEEARRVTAETAAELDELTKNPPQLADYDALKEGSIQAALEANQAISELAELGASDTYLSKIESFIEKVQQESANLTLPDAAQPLDFGSGLGAGASDDDGGDSGKDPAEKYREDIEKLRTLKTEFAIEREQIFLQAEQATQRVIDTYAEIDNQQVFSARERAALLIKIEEDRAKKIADIEQREHKERVKSGESFFKSALSGAAQYSKKAFELQKIQRISEATIAGIKGVQDSYAWGASWGGPPGGAAMAGIAAIATGINIKAINDATFGGSAQTPSASASGAESAVVPDGFEGQSDAEERNAAPRITAFVIGDPLLSDGEIKDRMRTRLEELHDGGEIQFGGGFQVA